MGGGVSSSSSSSLKHTVGYSVCYRAKDGEMLAKDCTPSSRHTSVAPKLVWLAKNLLEGNSQLSDFDIGRIIGKGLMGTVRIARYNEKNSFVAIKSIKKRYIAKHKDERHINNERKIMMELNSSFCVKLFSCFQDTNNIYFAMELVPGGELFHRLVKVEKMDANTAQFYAWETYSALYHLQSLGYVYRDLKPENVLIDAEGHCKLIDFGFSTRPDSQGLMRTSVGTPLYLSPEQLNGKFTGGYTASVDWWSFGVFLFELLTGRTPFSKNTNDTHYEVYIRILKSNGVPFPWGFDPLSKSLISELCQKDMKRRLIDPKMIVKHKYFSQSPVEIDGARGVSYHWETIEDRRLIPPYIPRLSNDRHADDRYFGDKFDDDEFKPNSFASGKKSSLRYRSSSDHSMHILNDASRDNSSRFTGF